MKIRTSFVTNSSSSSFICEVCGNNESGYDMSYSDAGFVQCENGHEFCEGHRIEVDIDKAKAIIETAKGRIEDYKNSEWYCNHPQKQKERIDDLQGDIDNIENGTANINDLYGYYFEDGDINAAGCPICTLEHIGDKEIVMYVAKTRCINVDTLKQEIKEKFRNHRALRKFIGC